MAYIDNFKNDTVYTEYNDADISNGHHHTIDQDEGSFNKELEENFINIRQATKAQKKKPIIHWKTRNRSFIDLHNDLKKLGIKNNKFFLRLYQSDLEDVDVYAPVVPLELQIKIIVECIINPWYFLREVCRIPVDGAEIAPGGGIQYQIDRNNAATWYLFLNGIDHYSSKARQTGKTQDAIAKINYAYHFGTVSSSITFGNKDATLARENLYRLKSQRDLLPKWLQMRLSIDDDGKVEKEIDNVTMMKNPITKNIITTLPRATSVLAAQKIGRGKTTAIQYWDEFDFTPYNTEIIDASVFAYRSAAKSAIANKSIACRIFTSTPADLDNRDGAAATKFVNNMLVWKDTYYDIPINEFRQKCTSKGRNGIVFVEHTWRQLKKSMTEWYEPLCRDLGYDATKILREIELKRIRGTDRSPFTKDATLWLSRHVPEPIHELDFSNNLSPILVYKELHKSVPYIIAIDPSEGLGQDNNAFTVINPYDLTPVAEFKSPYISPPDFVKLICKLMDTYIPKSMLVIENNRGRELINRFMESKYKNHIWYDMDKLSQVYSDHTDKYGAAKAAASVRRAYGIATVASVRNRLFTILEDYVVNDREKLLAKYMLDDILGLERKASGRVEAGPGMNDDNIISYLLGVFVYLNATNLEEFGIIRGARPPEDTIQSGPEAEKAKVLELLQAFPDELQSALTGIFGDFTERNPVKEAEQYRSEIARYHHTQSQVSDNDDDVFMDKSYSEAFDSQIWDLNDSSYNDLDNRFDVEDYI